MSTVVEVPEATEAAKQLVQLSKEYTQKLKDLKESAYSIPLKGVDVKSNGPRALRVKDVKSYLQYLRPAAEQLARQASQLVQHGAINDTTRLELRLRLAELEHALFSATDAVKAIPG